MTTFLRLSNGIARSFPTGEVSNIYDEYIKIVESGATGNELNGPISAGTSITLPDSQTYSSLDLEVYLNGERLEPLLDYVYVGSAPRTQIQMTFELIVGDKLTLRIENGS